MKKIVFQQHFHQQYKQDKSPALVTAGRRSREKLYLDYMKAELKNGKTPLDFKTWVNQFF